MLRYFINLEKKAPWGVIAFIFGIISILIALYVAFIYTPPTSLSYEITSYTKVMDIYEDVSKLDIFYDGTNIKSEGKILTIVTLNIINNGRTSIDNNSYDEENPLGFAVYNGIIVDNVQLIDASNEYLLNNLKITQIESTKVIFSKAIIEPDEFFKLKILILHEKSENPIISSEGKIVGIKNIQVIKKYLDSQKEPLLNQIFSGSIIIQVLRIILYPVIFFAAIILIIIPTIIISDKYSEHKRKDKVKEFIFKTNLTIEDNDKKILNLYVENGDAISDFKKIINLNFNIDRHYNEIIKSLSKIHRKKHLQHFGTRESRIIERELEVEIHENPIVYTLIELERLGILYDEKGAYKIHEKHKDIITGFVIFIEKDFNPE